MVISMWRSLKICFVLLLSVLCVFPLNAFAENEISEPYVTSPDVSANEDLNNAFNFDELTYTNMLSDNITIGVGETYKFGDFQGVDLSFVNHRYISNDEKVAQVDENGLITAVEKGNAVVTLQLENSTDYICTVTVCDKPTKIEILNTDLELVKGWGNTKIEVKLSGGYTQFLTYTSSDTKVLTVDETGLIKPIKAGTSIVKVSIYNGLSASVKIKVINENKALKVNKKATKVSYKYSNVNKYVFGKSEKGKNLEAFIITPEKGKYTKTYVMTFAIHGHEDRYSHDALVLTDEANKLVEYYAENSAKLKNFRLIIIPCLNPDGAINGKNNLRFGKKAFGRCTAKHIDMNRDFTSKKIRAKESKALVKFLDKYKPDVFTDFHGWLNETMGTTDLCKIFDKNMNLGIKMKGKYFSSYLYAYVNEKYNCPSALIEYKSPKKLSHKKTYTSVNKVISRYNKK